MRYELSISWKKSAQKLTRKQAERAIDAVHRIAAEEYRYEDMKPVEEQADEYRELKAKAAYLFHLLHHDRLKA